MLLLVPRFWKEIYVTQPPDEDQPQKERPQPTRSPSPSQEAPVVVEKVDRKHLQHFVTKIRSAEQQVGENIIQALQHDNTVAVLTTVVMGPDGQQRVISAALNPNVMDQVQELLTQASEEREPEEPCVGFHCLVKPKIQNT